MVDYTSTFGKGVMPTFAMRPGQGSTSWMYGGDESKVVMDEYLADRAAKKAELKDDFTNSTIPALKALLNPDEPEADPLDAYFEQANAEAEAAQLSKELNANAAAVQAMTSDDAYTYTPEDQAALEASELGEDIMSAGGMLGGGPAAQYLGARQALDLVDSAQGKIRGGESVKNTIKKALNAPGIKGQLAKKIAMRAALMGTGPLGIAILLGDLAYMGAKAGSGYLADKGYIEQDYVGNFEDAVGESAGNFMDMIRGDEDFEVGSNTKADGGRIGFMDGGMGFKDVIERFAEGLTERELIEFEMMSPEQQMEVMKRAGVMRDDMNTGGRVYYADGTNEEGVQGYSDKSFYDSSGPISEEVAALQQRYMDDLNPTGMEAFKQMSEQFSDVAPEQIMDIIENKFPQYMNDPTDPFAGMEMEGEMAYGGRVGLQAGGLPFTPFMAPNYAAQYYNQNFNVPTIVPPAIQPILDPDANNSGATGPMPPEGFGSLGPENIKPLGSKGPEDRMEGFRPQDNPLSFSNPANQTTMKFVDGKLVYDNVNPYLRTGVVPGDEVPIASPLFAGLNLLGGLFGFDQKQKEIDDEIAEFNQKTAQEVIERQKKEKEEREAAAAQKAAEEAAAEEEAQTLKETYAANQYSGGTGSGDNKPSGTGTFSGGTVSGYTGGAQSPHSSMSTATQSQVNAAMNANKNKNKDKDKNKNSGGGGGYHGGGADHGGKQGQSRCFVKGTMVEMADGTTKEITTITPGMETRGGTVEFVLQGLPVDIWDYKGVKVSGTHWVVEDNQLIAVEDSKHGIKTDMFEPVYSMKTSKQRMWVKGIEFGDFESGTDEDWEPYFEKVRQDLNKKLHEKRKENQQSDERV